MNPSQCVWSLQISRCDICQFARYSFTTSKSYKNYVFIVEMFDSAYVFGVIYCMWRTICGTNIRFTASSKITINLVLIVPALWEILFFVSMSTTDQMLNMHSTVIETIQSMIQPLSHARKRLGSERIHRLRTFYPFGLNLRNWDVRFNLFRNCMRNRFVVLCDRHIPLKLCVITFRLQLDLKILTWFN